MKQYIKAALYLVIIAFVFSSCEKEPKQLKYISKGAKMVITISPMNIFKKADLGNEEKYSFLKSFKSSLENEDAGSGKLIKTLLDDPSASGINFKQDIFGVVDGKGLMNSKMMLMVELKSREDLESTINELLKDMPFGEIEKKENYSQIIMNNMGIGWNDEVACISSAARYRNDEPGSDLEKIFSTVNAGIGKETAFKDYYKKHQDISMWMNASFTQDFSNGMGMISGAASGMAMKGIFASDSLTFMSTYINFNDGNITIRSEQSPSEELKKLMEKYPYIKEELDAAILKFIPQEAYILARISINPKNLETFMTKSGAMDMVENMVKELEEELEMSFDEMSSTFKGDAVFSLSGMAVEKFERTKRRSIYNSRRNPVYNEEFQDTIFDPGYEYKTYTDEKEEMIPHMHIVANLNNSSMFKKLIEEKGELQTNEAGYYTLPADDFPMYICLSDQHFLFTTSKTVADAFGKGGLDKNLASNSIVNKLESSAVYGYLNLSLSDYPEVFREKMDKEKNRGFMAAIINALSHYQDMELTMDGPYSSNFVIGMNDKNTNGLDAILTSIDQQINKARTF